MTVEHIISLLEFLPKTTYFEQLQGPAMDSSINPIVTKLYMEDFETKAIKTAEHPPGVWKRYVDDAFVATYSSKKDKFH